MTPSQPGALAGTAPTQGARRARVVGDVTWSEV